MQGEKTMIPPPQASQMRIIWVVQNIENVIHVKAERIEAMCSDSVPPAASRMIFTEAGELCQRPY